MMELVDVSNAATRKAFAALPRQLHQMEANFIPVPDQMVDRIFDARHNRRAATYRHKRWLLLANGRYIGRIAAFEHPKLSEGESGGGIGFFECVDDEAAAAILFRKAEDWLQELGCTFVDGPINFGENDQYWGLLVQGFESPSFGMNWNPAYYEGFFQKFGYQFYYEQRTNHLLVSDGLPDRFTKIAAWISQKGRFSLEHFQPKQLAKYTDAVVHVFNNAWRDFENFAPMRPEAARNDFKRLKPILRSDLIWFAFAEKEAVAFLLMVPDVNELFAKNKSRFDGWGKIQFWFHLRTHKFKRLKIIAMGVHAKYQGLGLESALIIQAHQQVLNKYPHIEEVELAWVGGFNEKMLAVQKAAGARLLRKHITYRKYFNSAGEVKKFEIKRTENQ